jgi:phenylalanyl-tRNA synthetase alpha chain
MQEELNIQKAAIENFQINNTEDLENYRLKFLSRKGIVNDFFEQFKALNSEKELW